MMTMQTTSRFSPGRRKLLLAGAGGAAVLGIFGAASWQRLTNYRANWVERVVRENLPGIDLDEESLRVFIKDALAGEWLQNRPVKMAVFADRFVPWLPARIAKARDGLEVLERRVLTEYLIGSNFFRIPDPTQQKIVYGGISVACPNPFTYSSQPALTKV